ncbi:MAG: hypothetical protein HZC28_14065 [Spirochaetes bacterium]|nr:hypothetical protein [Spirochaetota bacterium]
MALSIYGTDSIPADGLVLHLNTGTMSAPAGSMVGEWAGVSGGPLYSQKDEQFRPELVTDADSGQHMLRFAGRQILDGPAALPEGAGVLTIAAVWISRTHSGAQVIFEQCSSRVGGRAALLQAGSRYGFCGQNNDAFSLAPVTSGKQAGILTIEQGGKLRLTHNGALFTGAIDAGKQKMESTRCRIGAKGTGGEYLNGDIGEIIVWNRALDAYEVARVDEYFRNKWKYIPAAAEMSVMPFYMQRGAVNTLAIVPYRSPGNNLWDFWFARNDNTYHAFYLEYPDSKSLPDQSQRHGRQWVGHATSADLVHWQEQPTALFETGKGIATGSVVRHEGKWYMLVTHKGFSLAESDDLRTWLWTDGNPVYRNEVLSGDWQGAKVSFRLLADPYIYPEQRDGFWYAAVNAHIQGAKEGERGAQVLIRSRDLRAWEGYKVCAWDRNYERMETSQIWEHAGRWYMYFGAVYQPARKNASVNLIYMAKSFDGPYEAQPWSEMKLPVKGYIGKRIVAPDGNDVFLMGQTYNALSKPISMKYGVDGMIDFE